VFFYWASKKVSIGLDFKLWSVRGYGVFRGTPGRKGPPADNRQKRPPANSQKAPNRQHDKKSPHQTTGKRPPPDNMKRKTTNIQQAKRPRMEQKPTNLITGLEQ